jgi:hypothetical protein
VFFLVGFSGWLGMRCAGLDPVDVEVALGEQPGTAHLDERVAVSKMGNHQLALTVFGVEVVSDAVALPRRPVAVENDGALPVEVRRRLLAVEVLGASKSLNVPWNVPDSLIWMRLDSRMSMRRRTGFWHPSTTYDGASSVRLAARRLAGRERTRST